MDFSYYHGQLIHLINRLAPRDPYQKDEACIWCGTTTGRSADAGHAEDCPWLQADRLLSEHRFRNIERHEA
jgi:hypothetical protein